MRFCFHQKDTRKIGRSKRIETDKIIKPGNLRMTSLAIEVALRFAQLENHGALICVDQTLLVPLTTFEAFEYFRMNSIS